MATQIDNFGITQLTLAAHAKFHNRVVNLIAVSDLEALHLVALAPPYMAAVTQERAAINRPTAYAETPKMVAVDHSRDQAISQVFNLVSVFLKSTLPDEVTAAMNLHAIMAPYHGIQEHEYNRKTMEVTGLLNALNSALPADVNTCCLASAIEQIDKYNSDFDALLTERSADSIVRTPIKLTDTPDLRSTSDTLYREIVSFVNAYAITVPSADLEAFTVAVNVFVAEYKNVIANQGKGGKVTPPVVADEIMD